MTRLTRYMAMPSLMAARWVGQDSGPKYAKLSLPVQECP